MLPVAAYCFLNFPLIFRLRKLKIRDTRAEYVQKRSESESFVTELLKKEEKRDWGRLKNRDFLLHKVLLHKLQRGSESR